MKLTVKYEKGEKTKAFTEKLLLGDALLEMGFSVGRPCGGGGDCGACQVIANGKVVRSCSTYLDMDMVVELSMDMTMQIVSGKADIGRESGGTAAGYGLAVDIGTTTIAGYLYELPAGRLVREVGVKNKQVSYGADVMTRMEQALQGKGVALQESLQKQLETLAGGMPIERCVICGNTVMLHLLAGLSVRGLSCAPYEAESLFGEWRGNTYLTDCISAFVGADTVCAVLDSEMWRYRVSLLVDIGTNAEMVLYKDGKYFCCSAAAGPALEGGEISMGMPAVEGAIDRVYVECGSVHYSTIGGGAPKGLCGSGLMDAVAVLLELGIVDGTGYLEEPYEIPGSGVFILPEDIRQVQLAKGAIRAGVETLLYACGVGHEDVERLYIAGGFGHYLDKTSVAATGLLPRDMLKRSETRGNAAGKGACRILLSEEALKRAGEIAGKAMTVSLADSAYFCEKYVEYMLFE